MKKSLGLLACLLVFGSLFVCLASPVSEPDFWWHLASGRSMAENRAFLERDPFTIDADFGGDEGNASFILTYSWLSQVAVFEIHDKIGMEGVVLFFSAIYTTMFAVLYRLLRRSGADLGLALFFVALSFSVIVLEFHYNVPRPQAWSALFSVVTIYLIEEVRMSKKWAEYVLPPMMMLWANLHGGYVLGDLILFIHAVGAAISRTGSKRLYVLTFLSILASGINPNGFRAALSFPILGPLATSFNLVSQKDLKSILDSIVENQSLFGHASVAGILRRLPFLCAFVLVSLGSFLLNARNFKRIRVDHLLLFVVLLVMGTRSIRYIVFLVAIGSVIAAANLRMFLDTLTAPAVRRATGYLLVAVNAIFLYMVLPAGAAQAGKSAVASGVLYHDPYENVLRFMKQAGLRGNIFNDYNAGGPIIWGLSPGMKVFVDGRAIHPMAMQIQQDVMDMPLDHPAGYETPNYRMAFERYGIDYVLIPGCAPVSGTLIRLAPALIEDPGWRLIYADDKALLFAKNEPAHEGIIACFGKPAYMAYENILAMANVASGNGHARQMAGWKLSKAVGYAGLGDSANAGRWLDAYLSIVPYDRFALSLKQQLAASGRNDRVQGGKGRY
ncbi:MAG TPA: hypothetical protein VIU29_07195 [Candidatus Deferrimicrobiaceae bacterium]